MPALHHIEAGSGEGTFATRPLLFAGNRLVVNCEPLGPDARLQVQLIGVGIAPGEDAVRGKFFDDAVIPGFEFAKSHPIATDELDGAVRWSSDAELGSWAGKAVRLHFRLRNMRIYAFQFIA